MSTFYHNGINYGLRVVSSTNYEQYEDWLSRVRICSRDVISEELEEIAISILQDDDAAYGFFISDNNFATVKAFVIIDGECSETSDKVASEIDISKCAEITLFCSNKRERVSGLASALLNFVIMNVKKYIPTCNTVLLLPANKNKGSLTDFYRSFGFSILKDTPRYRVMRFDVPRRGGGYRNKIQRTLRHRRKSKQNNNKRHQRKYTKKHYSFK